MNQVLQKRIQQLEQLVELHRAEIDSVCEIFGIDKETSIDEIIAICGEKQQCIQQLERETTELYDLLCKYV